MKTDLFHRDPIFHIISTSPFCAQLFDQSTFQKLYNNSQLDN